MISICANGSEKWCGSKTVLTQPPFFQHFNMSNLKCPFKKKSWDVIVSDNFNLGKAFRWCLEATANSHNHNAMIYEGFFK